MARVILNPDAEWTHEIKKRLKENNGYCPCSIVKTEDTKCKCKGFRDMVARGETGPCHCGLFIAVE